MRVDKNVFAAHLAGCFNFGIWIGHFSASRLQSVADDCGRGLDFYINSLIYSGGKINDQLFEARLMKLFARTVSRFSQKLSKCRIRDHSAFFKRLYNGDKLASANLAKEQSTENGALPILQLVKGIRTTHIHLI